LALSRSNFFWCRMPNAWRLSGVLMSCTVRCNVKITCQKYFTHFYNLMSRSRADGPSDMPQLTKVPYEVVAPLIYFSNLARNTKSRKVPRQHRSWLTSAPPSRSRRPPHRRPRPASLHCKQTSSQTHTRTADTVKTPYKNAENQVLYKEYIETFLY
jgi:hypothetical protein